MSTAIERVRPQEQALVKVAEELGILQRSAGAVLINLGDPRLKEKYNVLAPATTLAKADPNFTPALHVVNLDPADFYPTAYEGKGQDRRPVGWSLSKVQLDQIARVAGIEDLPPDIVYFGSEHQNLRVTWTARMRRPDGTWQTASGSREWIEFDEREQLLAAVPKWVTDQGALDSSNPAFVSWWSQEWYGRVRKHRLGVTETKARLRAYRSLLTVKSKYNAEEIRKPFLVASTSFTPDTSDVRVLSLLMSQGRQAAELLYGPGGSQPVEPRPALETPPEACDPETGEVIDAEPEPVTHGERPAEDLRIPKGPYEGEMLSEVARKDPDYTRRTFAKSAKWGPIAEEWRRYWHGEEDYDDVAF